jgi:aldehyde dehydrogenase (NAD+)
MLSLTTEIAIPNGNKYDQPTGLFINNEFVASGDGKTEAVYNPGNGELICSVHLASVDDINRAVDAAEDAFFNRWSTISGKGKSEYLYKIADLIVKYSSQLADLEAIESGKPKDTNAIFDVLHSADVFRYYAGKAVSAQDGKTVETELSKFTYTVHEPYGVCAAIIAWNFPMSTFSWKVAACLAAGNTMVVKTSELTPLSALFMCKIFQEADLPAGVINITCGTGAVAGSRLSEHKKIQKISFTGSTGVGKLIQESAAKSNLKYCTLECGGKSPLVILEDADLEQAVKWAAFGIFFNKGEICTASSRIYVQESIYDKFLTMYKDHVEEAYVQGDQFTPGVNVGPTVSKAQQEKILGFIESARKEGGRIISGGGIPTTTNPNGFYLQPTIVADCNQNMTVVKEEIFGPVVTVSKFTSDDEAIKLSNDSEYGLAAYLFTKDIQRSQNYIRKVQSGQVFVNFTFAADFRMPFGGYKMSGNGRELGDDGLKAFQQVKAVHINLAGKL